MKPYPFIAFVLAAMAGRAQQLPSQIQAKRGVFTDRLYLNGQWINRISTDLSSADDSSNSVLTTGKAVTDFVRLHSLQNGSVTADGDYIHNWNHKQFRIDSINHLQLDAFESDSTLSGYPKVHNTFQLFPGAQSNNAINLTSALRRININDDSITTRLNISPNAAMLRTDKYQSYFITGYDGSAVTLKAYNSPNSETFQVSEVDASPLSLILSNSNGNIYMLGLRSTSDATTYKPLGFDSNTGKLAWMNAWPSSSGSGLTIKDTSYSPVFTAFNNVKNVSGSITGATRIGSTVQVSGVITVTPDSASGANTSLEISVPWLSNGWGPGAVSGTAFNADYQVSAQITGSFDMNKALFKFSSVTTNPITFSFSFQYTLILFIIIPIDPHPIP
jgi:hypothetical protein